ncbi:LLM class flavin-dependent oxidoreductase, partial [Streptomyces sp. SID10244]|nr:LLM class flavin-dependent oxidoreductase [Streptomyces sp. SID10244]
MDSGVAGRLAEVPQAAVALEGQAFDGCWVGETKHDPFLSLTLAAEHTSRIELGTNVAVAFARNPMSVASLAWDLQDFSQGRFNLGLGTQIKPHIEKRFGMPWSEPADRMREFIDALHAIWSA